MLSRSKKIVILLVIDIIFFLIELIVGYAVGSLALIADSFHMLNDVMSLIVALYAIKLASKTASTNLSYGWHRAEILAALINGVFLLALCFSIFMEAIERFFEVPEIKNPMLVVIVGCFGLASNILGLFLFHEHSHNNGNDKDHSHAEPGHSHLNHTNGIASAPKPVQSPEVATNDERTPLLSHTGNGPTTPPLSPAISVHSPSGRPRSDSVESLSLFGHPIQNRAYVIAKAQDIALASSYRASSPPASPTLHRRSTSFSHNHANSFSNPNVSGASIEPAERVHTHEEMEDEEDSTTPIMITPPVRRRSQSRSHVRMVAHQHRMVDEERAQPSKGHHGSMNMRALLLHVLGDALGNVGVIASGLIIWQTTWKYRFYSDPIISLLITVIIFSSALPLVKSASFILLQGVPENVDFDNLCNEINNVTGVVSIHELHVWQLSETRHIASVHIRLEQKADYMRAVHDIRRILHRYDIHNATIQPEFGEEATDSNGNYIGSCMVACPPGKDCNVDQICCPPGPTSVVSVEHHR